MVSLESKAAWEARARAIGVPEGFLVELQGCWTHLDNGRFAAKLTRTVLMIRRSKLQWKRFWGVR